jgi:hypothetical protein
MYPTEWLSNGKDGVHGRHTHVGDRRALFDKAFHDLGQRVVNKL